MDPTRQAIDSTLLILGLAAYITGTLVLLTFFLTRSELARRIGGALAIAGCAAQFAELGTRWWMTGVWPLTNLYGSLSLFSAVAVGMFAIFAARYGLWVIGWIVVGIAAIALGYGTTWNEGYMPAVPALQSYWIKIHVPIVITSYATFLSAFAVSVVYLIKDAAERSLRRGSALRTTATAGGPALRVPIDAHAYAAGGVVTGVRRDETPAITAAAAAGDPWAVWLAGLPTLARLDALTYKIVAVGVPLLAIGIITGAIWAKEAWGAYWQWDPKETAALASWIIYAIYLHLYTRPDWKGRRLAWLSVAAFASIIFCYLGVNIWVSGLHSYKM